METGSETHAQVIEGIAATTDTAEARLTFPSGAPEGPDSPTTQENGMTEEQKDEAAKLAWKK